MPDARSAVDRQLPILDEIFLDHVAHFVREPQLASRALARAGFAPTAVSIQVAPDPDGAPRPTGTGNVTAMFVRGYIEVLFKTADTPLGRELEAARARYPGVHLAAFACGPWCTCSARSTPAGRPEPLRSRWRGSSRGKCRRDASKSSPTAPRPWSGSRAGCRIPTAHWRSRAS